MKFYIKNILINVFLLSLLSNKSFAMDRYLIEEHRNELIQILDQLMPMEEIKPIHALKSRSSSLKTKEAEKWMNALIFEKIPKIIIMDIMRYFSFYDLENLTKVSGFFVFAEHRLRFVLQEMSDGISKIYITPDNLLSTYSQESLKYFLEYHITKYKKKISQDFSLDNGEFSLRNAYLSALDNYENIHPLCLYLKTNIALDNEKVIEDFCSTKLHHLSDLKKGVLNYIELVIMGDIMSFFDNKIDVFTNSSILSRGEILNFLEEETTPLHKIFFNFQLREIDWARKNMIFCARAIALQKSTNLSSSSAIFIEGIIQEWLNIPLKNLREKREPASKDQQEYIYHHRKFELLCQLIKLNAKLSFCVYTPFDWDYDLFFRTPVILKNFIPEKKLAIEYLKIMSQSFISFRDTPILFTCNALKEIVNLEEIEELMKILQPILKKNQPFDFEALDLKCKEREQHKQTEEEKVEKEFFKRPARQTCLIL